MKDILKVKGKAGLSEKDLANMAIKASQNAAKDLGLEVGDIVCHPSDRFTYRLFAIEGDKLHVERPGKNSTEGDVVKKIFPREGTFDYHMALYGAACAGNEYRKRSSRN